MKKILMVISESSNHLGQEVYEFLTSQISVDVVKRLNFGHAGITSGINSSKKVISVEDNNFDLMVCIGGDGTLLNACSLFSSTRSPPFLTFNSGNFGFLSSYNADEYRTILTEYLKNSTNFSQTKHGRISVLFWY